jgi:hypothetical protein
MMNSIPTLRHTVLAMALLLVSGTCMGAQDLRLPPVDDAAADATWIRFKTLLLDTLARRDHKGLLNTLNSGIRNLSGKAGTPEFARIWRPDKSDSPVWTELPKLLHLGGTYIKRNKAAVEFCAPYVHFLWPANLPQGVDAAITARDVLLKAKPSAEAETRSRLSYDLVNVLDWDIADENPGNAQQWVKIQIENVSGYVPDEHIRSPQEYHACFVKSGAGWRISAFSVGQ